MKTGDKVYWRYNGKIYKGTLNVRDKIIGEVPMDEAGFTGRYKKTDYWEWTINGDDGHTYCIEENRLTKDIIDLAN